ncbi:TetR/AcrR family transcriptional regulator [Dialister sp.]|jgi:AcrR family transcriptional regulator|uniref:TetR/AcrR family transcriptional regulator n=1 Tax=Dialister sp. TaxID=1955814 RepID=UPI003A5C6C97
MAKAEKRAVHMKGIRSRILKTAENLFLEQGYKTTTIRQIVQDSGITSGSIYNIYEDKEHLFAALIDEFLNDAANRVGEALEDRTPEQRLVGFIAMELYSVEKSPVIREMMYAAHSSPLIMESVIENHAYLAREIWDARRHTKIESLSTALLLSEGAVASYVLCFAFSEKLDYSAIRKRVMFSILRTLGLDTRETNKLIAYMEENKDLWLSLADQVLHHSEEIKA